MIDVKAEARLHRLAAWTLTVALMFASTAVCLAGAAQAQAQDECCAAMGHECGSSTTPRVDCCTTNAPNSTALLSAVLSSFVARPAPIAATQFAAAPRSESAASFLGSLDSVAAKPPGTSTHLLVSVFRI